MLPPPLPLSLKKKKKQPTLRQYYVSCCCCRSFMQENLSYKYCHHYARQIRKWHMKSRNNTYICLVNWQFKNGYLSIKLLGFKFI
jgi:hypothetical protein